MACLSPIVPAHMTDVRAIVLICVRVRQTASDGPNVFDSVRCAGFFGFFFAALQGVWLSVRLMSAA